MNLLRTSFWTGIATVIKLSAALVTNKIMAVVIGPSGVALLGNFTNITTILGSFSNGAIGSGIVKYIAEFEKEEEKKSVISHAILINLICSFVIGGLVLILNKTLASFAFKDQNLNSIFIIFGITVVFYGLNTTLTSILNGYKEIKYLILTGVIGSIISLLLAYIITVRFGLYGALINTIIAQVFIFILNWIFVAKLKVIKKVLIATVIDKKLIVKLLKFGLMSVASLSGTATLLIIRKYVYEYYSPNEAGYLQGLWTISSNYLLIITTSLTIYYLPTLASIKGKEGIKKEIINGYKLLVPVCIFGALVIFFSRELIIRILFTSDFFQMKDYFAFQLIGDTFKISAWILSYLMVAKAMTRWFILSEILFSVSYIGFGLVFMHFYGSIGITYAYALNYLFYLVFLLLLFKKYLFFKPACKK